MFFFIILNLTIFYKQILNKNVIKTINVQTIHTFLQLVFNPQNPSLQYESKFNVVIEVTYLYHNYLHNIFPVA